MKNIFKILNKYVLLGVLFILNTPGILSQSIWTNPITATNPNTANPFTAGQTVNSSISVSGIGRGTGITGTNANDRYTATGWNSASLDANDYYEFTLTPNTGCNISFASFVYTGQASGTGPGNFAFRSSLDGFTTNIGTATATGATINLSAAAYQTITGAITFRIYGWGATAAGGTWSVNDFTFNGTVTCGAVNTITTGLISSPPFNLAYCTSTASGIAAFTSSGTFSAGNIYTVQLSDASGNFGSPVNIGTLSSVANSGNINFVIPAGTGSGSSYKIRIISSNPSVTGSSSSAFTITSGCSVSCPEITGVLINACDGSCSEGDNEIIFLNSKSYSIPVSPANIIIKYGTTNPPTATYTDAFTTNAAQIANLNTLAGCGTLFIDASAAGTIPANSAIMLTRSTACFNFDFSSYCGLGPVYVLFSTDPTWLPGGNFANSGTGNRYFESDFSALTGGCITDDDYMPSNLPGGDGAAISFPAGGGSANAYYNSGCTPPQTILPIELLDFYVTTAGSNNDLTWKVAEEDIINYYTVGKSNNGIDFNEIAKLLPGLKVGSIKNYSLTDDSPFNDITYYRLSTKEKDGSVKHYRTISVDSKTNSTWDYIHYANAGFLTIEFKNYIPANATTELYDLSGKLLFNGKITESKTEISTGILNEGIYFVKLISPQKTEYFKTIISK